MQIGQRIGREPGDVRVGLGRDGVATFGHYFTRRRGLTGCQIFFAEERPVRDRDEALGLGRTLHRAEAVELLKVAGVAFGGGPQGAQCGVDEGFVPRDRPTRKRPAVRKGWPGASYERQPEGCGSTGRHCGRRAELCALGWPQSKRNG